MSLVSRNAPDFTAAAVLGNGEIVGKLRFSEATKGKHALVVFYPLDFTFVCPSELIALDKRIEEFKKRKVEVFTVSVDSQFTHNAWRNTPIDKGGIGPVRYTMVADLDHSICQSYGVDLPIGRNIDEFIRLVDALQFFEEHGEVCPAGWHKGQSGMKASPKGVADYLARHVGDL
jgi:peroxiredoxin (alkyl hydroperoxide reductase subunit C)